MNIECGTLFIYDVMFESLGLYDVDVEIDAREIQGEPYPHLQKFTAITMRIGLIKIEKALDKAQSEKALDTINKVINTPKVISLIEEWEEQNDYMDEDPWL
jgi:hypothetical protein